MSLKSFATPLTIASFITSAATGLLMFFGVKAGLVVPVHEWVSILFVAGGILHVVANGRATLAHLRRPVGATLACVCTVVAVAAVLPSRGGANPHHVLRQSMDALLDTDIQGVAALTKRPEREVKEGLARAGFTAPDGAASLRAIAKASGRPPLELLAAALPEARPEGR
ncbi:DUF4405 domain-containing protein [Mesoterricola silvestris]|uniref:Flavinylation-associated cytochrome domain-containing protein n=1 Tax=Mesoterricola silvestris TaxID=2927979 RepID=A0AA48H118_9BACT|nr:DUF4405 domain-containing protein [Mesoterricola silvestris]BDU74068.1 hypothetical protein METEAL_32420 [Mesoterricola silvestris]